MKRFPVFSLLIAGAGAVVSAHAGAKAPPGRYDYTAGSSTVLDTKTGLRWQRKQSVEMVWDMAVPYCPNTYGNGWRLPTIRELQTIVDDSLPGNTYDSAVFLFENDSAILWSSTPNPKDPTLWVYLVSLREGHTVSYQKTLEDKVLCVTGP